MDRSTHGISPRHEVSAQEPERQAQQVVQVVEAALHPRRVVTFLVGCVSFLVVAGVAGEIAVLRLPDFMGRDVFAPLMDLRAESSIPSTFSALILLVAGLLFWVISAGKYAFRDRFAITWRGLAILLFYLALDENTQIHERTSAIAQRSFNTDGLLLYAWVIPYAALALVIGFALIKFLIHLPAHIRILFFISGTMYLSGALGFEMLEGQATSADIIDQIRLVLLTSVEEALEMFAVVLLIGALLEYIRTQMPRLLVRMRINPERG